MALARSIISPEALALLPQDGFTKTTVLVIGDLMLDKYIEGEVHRISPEAPVPVLSVTGERTTAGGAANVALNAAGLGAKTLIVGIVGADLTGRCLLTSLTRAGVNVSGVIFDETRPTTCKTRVIAGNHQIVRLDEEVSDDMSAGCERSLLVKVRELLDDGVSAVILSDYAKGVLSNNCPQTIIGECQRRGIPVLVDPKRHDYDAFSGATCITPNWKEFKSALTVMAIPDTGLKAAASALRKRLTSFALLVTQGSEGMTLVTEESAHHLPAIAEEVFDVSGAGDTVIATLSTALGASLPFLPAVELANAAASLVVRRSGTTPIAWADLYDFVTV